MTRTSATKPGDDQSRQKRAGEAIRQRSREKLLLGAGEVFAEQGYAGATVAAIAERAGVSLQTLYTAWGSKRRLLRAYVEYTMTGSPTAITDGNWVPQLQRMLDAESGTDPLARMASVARIFCELAPRMALPWRLTRDGAAIDPGVAEDHAELNRYQRGSMAGLLEGIDQRSLRPGLTMDGAIDTLMIIASAATYQALVEQQGYSIGEFRSWLEDTLVAALLADHVSG